MHSSKAARALLVSVFTVLLSPGLAAKGLEQSYADVGYSKFNGDDFDVAGGTVDAAFGVFELVSLRAGYTRGWTDKYPKNQDPSGNPDMNQFILGLRPHYEFTRNLDLYVDLLYSNTKFNGDRSKTDIGWIYVGGLRWKTFKWLELNLAGEYRSGSIDAPFLLVNPVFKATRNLDVSVSTSQGQDDSEYFAGLRLKF
jgi:hypothetical protein